MSNRFLTAALAAPLTAIVLGACSAAPHAEQSLYAEAPPLVADKTYAPPSAYPEYNPDELDGAPRATVPPPAYVAPPPAPRAYEPPPIRRAASCDIEVRSTRNGVEITPVAMLDRAVSGEYDLAIRKSGASGSSDVSQGGPFRARAGERIALGETELSLGRRDHYRATLTLFDGRREICRREIRS
jgi:hypothetical protein